MSHGIFVPIDFSDVTEAVVTYATKLHATHGGKLWLVHVVDEAPEFAAYEFGPMYIRDNIAEQLRNEHRQLQEYEDRLREHGIDVTSMMVYGDPVKKIPQEIKRLDPDMVVLGSHGHGALSHLLTGSVCANVIRHAQCPIVVVPLRSVSKRKKEQTVATTEA